MTTTTAVSSVDIALDRLAMARAFTLSLIDSLSDDQLLARAGGKGNHPIWIMGHHAQAEDQIHSLFTGQPLLLSDEHHDLFRGGSQPSDDGSIYPGRQELLRRMEISRQQTEAWVKTLEGDAGLQPTPEELKPFAPTAIATAFTLAMHEFLHTGQIASVRSSLGLAPVHR